MKLASMKLLNAVRDFCSQHGTETKYYIALSGGLDSCVLLTLFYQLSRQQKINVSAIHVNHQLSPHADSWSQHCKQLCGKYSIQYIERIIRLELNAGDSLEELARIKRYRIFADCIGKNDILLTAHQLDDQAETVMLQLLRGAGPKGLSAMPVIKRFGRGYHGRPLLHFSRDDLLAYAHEHKLEWINDESNDDVRLTRNFLRHQVLSVIKSRWTSVASAISRSAAHCAESQALLEEFAAEIYAQVSGSRENTLSVSKLLQISAARQRLVLRTWILEQGYPVPDTRKIGTIQRDVLTAAWDRSPCVSWSEVELRRHRDDLYLMPALPETRVQQDFLWNLSQPLLIPGLGTLNTSLSQGQGLCRDIQQVTVKFRQGGEIVDLDGRGRHALKNLLQEWKTLPWERDRIPLLFIDNKLIGAVGYFLDKKYSARPEDTGYQIVFNRN
jgi:tRNA(Ile)-lysidine synthase